MRWSGWTSGKLAASASIMDIWQYSWSNTTASFTGNYKAWMYNAGYIANMQWVFVSKEKYFLLLNLSTHIVYTLDTVCSNIWVKVKLSTVSFIYVEEKYWNNIFISESTTPSMKLNRTFIWAGENRRYIVTALSHIHFTVLYPEPRIFTLRITKLTRYKK